MTSAGPEPSAERVERLVEWALGDGVLRPEDTGHLVTIVTDTVAAAVGAAVEPEVRGVALGVATLVFMVGGSVGSAVVGGLGQVIGLGEAMALLAVLPVVGLLVVAPTRRAAA